MSESFRGTLSQCIDRLRRLPRENIQRFTLFTKATPATSWRILVGEITPPGELWVRSAIFFHVNGWEVIELSTLPPEALGLAEIWALEVMTATEIKRTLNYNAPSNTGLLRLVYGQHTFMKKPAKRMLELLEEKHEAIAAAKIAFLEEFALVLDEVEEVDTPQHGDAVALLAQLLTEALPLAVALNDDDSAGSDERRERLRTLVGRGRADYSLLAVTLSQMKSAQTRHDARNGGRVR
ncbi:MAG TPA: hypothetical protein VM581_01460 [Magnetospirillaceae bacterium]|nr:hypothetical protein [Magnetospirillaceae bacterium]